MWQSHRHSKCRKPRRDVDRRRHGTECVHEINYAFHLSTIRGRLRHRAQVRRIGPPGIVVQAFAREKRLTPGDADHSGLPPRRSRRGGRKQLITDENKMIIRAGAVRSGRPGGDIEQRAAHGCVFIAQKAFSGGREQEDLPCLPKTNRARPMRRARFSEDSPQLETGV